MSMISGYAASGPNIPPKTATARLLPDDKNSNPPTERTTTKGTANGTFGTTVPGTTNEQDMGPTGTPGTETGSSVEQKGPVEPEKIDPIQRQKDADHVHVLSRLAHETYECKVYDECSDMLTDYMWKIDPNCTENYTKVQKEAIEYMNNAVNEALRIAKKTTAWKAFEEAEKAFQDKYGGKIGDWIEYMTDD